MRQYHIISRILVAILLGALICSCIPGLAADEAADEPSSPESASEPAKRSPPPVPRLTVNEKRSIIDEDPRLKRTVSTVMKDASVSSVLAKLTELTAVRLQASPDIKDKKLTVIGRGSPVVTIMAQMGYLFDWGWIKVTDKDEIAYKLQPRPGVRRRAQQLRDSILNVSIEQAANTEWQKTQPLLDAWIASRGDIDAVRDIDPSVADAIQNDPNLEYKLDNLTSMPEAMRYNWIVAQIRAANQFQGPAQSYGLVKNYLATNSISKTKPDAALAKKMSLKLADGVSLSGALEAFSKAAHLGVVADSYDRKTTLRTTEWKDDRISDVLDSISNDTGYDWIRSGGFLRFRNRTWFLDELRTVPEGLVKQWKELKDKQGHLFFQDYVGLVMSLTDDQLAGLADSGEKYGLAQEGALAVKYLPYFRFFGTLTPTQREGIWSLGGLTMAGMNRFQQEAFLRLMSLSRPLTPPYYAPGVVVYARQRGSQGYEIVLTFDVENARTETRLQLPGYQAPPAPAPAGTASGAGAGASSGEGS